MNIWIYTRTSSLTTFRKDSPDRQRVYCINNYRERLVGGRLRGVYSDNCSSMLPLEERLEWSALIGEISRIDKESAIKEEHIIFTESQSRISRQGTNQDMLRDWLIENSNVKVVAIGSEGIQETPEEAWPYVRESVTRMMQVERDRQQENQAYKRARAKSIVDEEKDGLVQTSKGNVRFDGRVLYANKYPGQATKVSELRSQGKTLRNISEILKGEGIVGYKGRCITPDTIGNIQKQSPQYLKGQVKAGSRSFSTKIEVPVQLETAAIKESGIKVIGENPMLQGQRQIEKQKREGTHQVWDDAQGIFYLYTKSEPYWSRISEQMLQKQLQEKSGIGMFNRQAGVIKAVRIISARPEFQPDKTIQAFKNGVYDLSSRNVNKVLQPHSPEYRVFNLIPHEYISRPISLSNMRGQIRWQSFITRGDRSSMKFLLYFAHQVLYSTTKHQIYQELYGPGGTGKSLALNIQTCLLSRNQVHIADQVNQEQNRFETSQQQHKKLILITDSPSYRGTMSILKAITGQDDQRYEEKGKQAGTGFKAQALIVISSNEQLASRDYSTGISRRRITFIMDRMPVEREENMLTFDAETKLWEGKLAKDIPFLLNYLLRLDPKEVDKAMRYRDATFPTIASNTQEAQVSTNPIFSFITSYQTYQQDSEAVIYQSASIDINENKEMLRQREAGHPRWYYSSKDTTEYSPRSVLAIYPMYQYHCDKIRANPISLNQFSSLFIDNFNKIHRVRLNKYKDSRAGVYFKGISVIDM